MAFLYTYLLTGTLNTYFNFFQNYIFSHRNGFVIFHIIMKDVGQENKKSNDEKQNNYKAVSINVKHIRGYTYIRMWQMTFFNKESIYPVTLITPS